MLDLPPLDIEKTTPESHYEQVVTRITEEETTSSIPTILEENTTAPQTEALDSSEDLSYESSEGTSVVSQENADIEGSSEEVSSLNEEEPTNEAVEVLASSEPEPTKESLSLKSSDEEEPTNEAVEVLASNEPEPTKESLSLKPSDEELLSRAKEIKSVFEDGFQWSDLGEIIKQSYEFAVNYHSMSSEDIKNAVITTINGLIDITDTPYLPDQFTDPVFKAMVPSFVDLFINFAANHFRSLPVEESEKPTPERLKEFSESLKTTFDDGFQISDLGKVVSSSIQFTGSFPFLSYEEKKQCIVDIVNHIVETTDIPYVPDTLLDPIIKSMVPSFIDTIFLKLKMAES